MPEQIQAASRMTKQAKSIDTAAVLAEADIGLINQHSLKELAPEEVFAFSVILCDNEVDRDWERFTDGCLADLAPMFVGKTGIFNHDRAAENQTARIYRTELVTPGGNNSQGEPLKQLKAYAYILRAEYTDWIIKNIEGGILKEVSVGFSVASCKCSVCGKKMYPWYRCVGDHQRGAEYDGQLCYGVLDGAKDAFEFSFVAVPAQRGAGVTKSMEEAEGSIRLLLSLDPAALPAGEREALAVWLHKAKLADDEQVERQKILAENAHFLKKEKEHGNDVV